MVLIKNPLWLLLVALGSICVILSVPSFLPIGPMYWDLYVYYDGVQRIFEGQVPSVDFSTPAGPLNYYLVALTSQIFTLANPYLLAQWSLMFFTIPIMGIIVYDMRERALSQAWLLTIFFLGYNIFSFNIESVTIHSGVEAWGLYNRHATQLLFVFVATIVFLQPSTLRTFILILLMGALFATKMTGFLAAGIIIIAFFMAGGLKRVTMLWVFTIIATLLFVGDTVFGFVGSYFTDIFRLLNESKGGLLYSFLSVIMIRFDLVLPAVLLVLLLAFIERDSFWPLFRPGEKIRSLLIRPFNTYSFLLAVLVVTAIGFESQNTGGQPLVLLVPFFIQLMSQIYDAPIRIRAGIYAAIAMMLVPLIAVSLNKASRAVASSAITERLETNNLGTLGLVTARIDEIERANIMAEIYSRHQRTYKDIVRAGTKVSFLIHAEPDFQILYLQELDKAIGAILRLEDEQDKTFKTVWLLDFANPLGWLMGRSSPRYVPIGVDPTRTVTALSDKQRNEIAQTDLTLIPLCPPTQNRAAIFKHYEPAFEKHARISLTPCMDAFVKEEEKPANENNAPVRVVPLQ